MTRIRVELREGIGRITLARPEKKNALDQRTAVELRSALEDLGADDDVRIVELGAEGPDFCAGADLEALEAMLDEGAEAHQRDAEALAGVFVVVRALAKPVVAVVRGRALAGGAGLATACDLVLAHEKAQFGYPEVNVGFVPAMVMTILRRSVGERQAFDLLATGRLVSADEALAMGLVSRVFPDTGFDHAVAETIAGLAKTSPEALQMTKRLFYALDGTSFEDGITLGVHTNVEARSTDAFRQGVRRFARRRTGGTDAGLEE